MLFIIFILIVFKVKIVYEIVEEARLRAEKEEIERREQEKREAAERLLRENEVIYCKFIQFIFALK